MRNELARPGVTPVPTEKGHLAGEVSQGAQMVGRFTPKMLLRSIDTGQLARCFELLCLSMRYFFTHFFACSSHFVSFIFSQSALVFASSGFCWADAGMASATARPSASADTVFTIGFLL